MGEVLIDEQNLQDIADSIRTKNGGIQTYLPSEMSTAILDLPSGEYELPVATKNTLGGIKVGDSLTINSNGTLSVSKGNASTAGVVKVGVANGVCPLDANGKVPLSYFYDSEENWY